MATTRPVAVAFLPLGYVNLTLLPSGSVANGIAVRERDPSVAMTKTIVYLDQAISSDKLFQLDVEYGPPRDHQHAFVLGLTTCNVASISNNFYHVQDECSPQFVCGGLSRSMPIIPDQGRNPIRRVQFTRDTNELMKIIINGRRVVYLQDETGRMTGKPLLPYVILSGSARRIKISECPMMRPQVMDVEEDLADSAFHSLWKLADGIDWNGKTMFRRANSGSRYAYCSLSMKNIEKLSFVIKESNRRGNGSLSFGITDWSVDRVHPNALPDNPNDLNTSETHKRFWRAFLNPISVVEPGTRVSFRYELNGLFLEVGSSKMLILPQYQFRNFSDVFVFLHFSGQVSHIQFDVPPEALRDVATIREHPVDSFMPDFCLVCYEKAPTHRVKPCGHAIICSDCSDHGIPFCLRCDKPINGTSPMFT